MKKLSFALLLMTFFSFQISDQRSIYLIPKMSSGVTAADYDMDGDLDIIVNHPQEGQTNWGGTYILKNDGYGYFTFYDSIYDTVGWYNRVGHLTGQAYPDIVSYARDSIQVLSTDDQNYWYNKYYVGPKVNDFELGDINNDGFTDILFSINVLGYWGILYNMNNEGFEEPIYYELGYSPNDIDCARIDNDTIDDIIIGSAQSEVVILLNRVDSFNLIKLDTFGIEVSNSDFNFDGKIDIISVSELLSTSIVRIYKNNGDETFSKMNEFQTPFFCTDFTVIDVNNDDFIDVIFQDHSGSIPGYHIYYNVENFQFHDSSFIPAEWMGETRRFMDCADMDGNGYDDLILSRQVIDISLENSPLEIFFNDGNGNFGENPLTSVKDLPGDDKVEINCYPNPFSNECSIEYNVEIENMDKVTVYNLTGQKIKDITNDNFITENKIIWNGTDENGKEVKPGIYIICLTTSRQTSCCRVIKNN